MKRIPCGLFGAIGAMVFCCNLSLAAALTNQTVSLAWDADTTGTIAGYAVYYGTASMDYTARVDTGTNSQVTLSGFRPQSTNYFTVVAYDSTGAESPPSGEIEYDIPVVLELLPATGPNSFVSVEFPVMNGHWYEVQATTDFLNWTTLWQTPVFDSDGDEIFPDFQSQNYPSRFYRLILH